MTDAELANILRHIEAALEVYRGHEGKYTAAEVSVKSMLTVMKAQVANQLERRQAFVDEQ